MPCNWNESFKSFNEDPLEGVFSSQRRHLRGLTGGSVCGRGRDAATSHTRSGAGWAARGNGGTRRNRNWRVAGESPKAGARAEGTCQNLRLVSGRRASGQPPPDARGLRRLLAGRSTTALRPPANSERGRRGPISAQSTPLGAGVHSRLRAPRLPAPNARCVRSLRDPPTFYRYRALTCPFSKVLAKRRDPPTLPSAFYCNPLPLGTYQNQTWITAIYLPPSEMERPCRAGTPLPHRTRHRH
nr:uncharacterized protein LOC116283493 [Vicugna pacos]